MPKFHPISHWGRRVFTNVTNSHHMPMPTFWRLHAGVLSNESAPVKINGLLAFVSTVRRTIRPLHLGPHPYVPRPKDHRDE